MTITVSFTGTGAGTQILVPNESTITYDLSGTFDATMQLVYSQNGGASWIVALELTAAGSGEYIVNSKTGGSSLVMWRCTAFTSGAAVTEMTGEKNSVTPDSDIMTKIINVGGYEVISFDSVHTDKPAQWVESGINCLATYNSSGDYETVITGNVTRNYTYDSQGRLTKIDVL
jgi:hypothetical protein